MGVGLVAIGRLADVEIGFADVAVGVGVFFVGLIGEDGGHAQVVLACFFFALEGFVVGDQGIGAADAEDGGKIAVVGFTAVVGDDPIDDAVNTLRVFKELFAVDAVHLLVDQGAIFALEFAPIFDGEFEDIVVGDGVGDDIAVQAFVEQVGRGAFAVDVAHGVVGKDGGAGEAEQLGLVEEFDNALVGVAKLGAVAFVEDEDDALVAQGVDGVFVTVAADGGVELLDGGDDERRVVRHLLHQLAGVVGAVDAVGAEVVEFFRRLVVEVGAVDDKDHFVHVGQGGEDLRRLEAGERFAGAGGVPDVAVFAGWF